MCTVLKKYPQPVTVGLHKEDFYLKTGVHNRKSILEGQNLQGTHVIPRNKIIEGTSVSSIQHSTYYYFVYILTHKQVTYNM